jgi:hypothetical protein
MNISEFDRSKPRKCFSFIKKLIRKYDKIVKDMPIMEDEDAIKVEMADDFRRELNQLMKIFKTGE